MTGPRGPLVIRRMTAHWVVLAAVALTTLVATAVAAALAVFAGQALPQAVRHDLVVAPGTALTATGSFSGSTVSTTTDALRSGIGAALSRVPFGFWQGIWSDPLGLVRGALPATPSGTGSVSCAAFIRVSRAMTSSGNGATFLAVISTLSAMFSDVADS